MTSRTVKLSHRARSVCGGYRPSRIRVAAVLHNRKRLVVMAVEEILDQLPNRQVGGHHNRLAIHERSDRRPAKASRASICWRAAPAAPCRNMPIRNSQIPPMTSPLNSRIHPTGSTQSEQRAGAGGDIRRPAQILFPTPEPGAQHASAIKRKAGTRLKIASTQLI